MLITKALGLVETVETDNPHGEFDVILSTTILDRDGEIVDSKAFDPLPDHIPFDVDHGMSVATTVGSGTPYYTDDGALRVKGTFASTALGQEVRTLVAEGHIRTTSVAFMSADRQPDEKGITHVRTAELLNGTFTPVPANKDAVVLSSKAFAAAIEEKVGARNSASDAANIQAAHDTMVTLGADCAGKSHTTDDIKVVPTDEELAPDVEAKSADGTDAEAAEAAATSAKSTDEADTMKAMAQLTENAAQLAFGG